MKKEKNIMTLYLIILISFFASPLFPMDNYFKALKTTYDFFALGINPFSIDIHKQDFFAPDESSEKFVLVNAWDRHFKVHTVLVKIPQGETLNFSEAISSPKMIAQLKKQALGEFKKHLKTEACSKSKACRQQQWCSIL